MRTINWTLRDGRVATYTVALVLSREINADGDRVTVPCCEIERTMAVAGMGYVGADIDTFLAPRNLGGTEVVAGIGRKVAITRDVLDQINAAVAEVEAAPEWQAKQETIRRNRAGLAAYEASNRRMGVCPHCGTICHGDCRAN